MPNSLNILANEAISLALEKNWKSAIEKNQRIIDFDDQNISALNRLSKAYIELDMYEEARKTLRKVLKLDPINSTALKNMELAQSKRKVLGSLPLPDLKSFIKEPGTSKDFTFGILTKGLTAKKFYTGEPINVVVEGHKISLHKVTGELIAVFDTPTANKVHLILKGGGSVSASFVSGNEKEVTLLVRTSVPIFRADRQDLKPYIKRDNLDEPEIELSIPETEET